MKRILVISTSPRVKSNSDALANEFIRGAKEAGHEVKIETQGTSGVQNQLTPEDIAAADVVIFAHDIAIRDKDRFNGKRIVDIPISTAMKSPKSLIATIEKKLGK